MILVASPKPLSSVDSEIFVPSKFNDVDYLAVMCHEIGTPLTAIVGLSHILTDVDCSPEKKKECAVMLRESARMLMELMKNMLDSARIGAGMVEIENILFDPTVVAQEAIRIMSFKAAQKGLELHVHIASDLPKQCLGDPLRIRQILLNLLGNAVKFTELGHVSLYMNAQTDDQGNDQLSIAIVDTGIGIGEGALEKIFGKYTQEHPGINREYGGSGLGLSISRDLAHMMHGEITVKSWPGMGSHFIVTLPLTRVTSLLKAA